MERPATVEERRQMWKDRYFNEHNNKTARLTVLYKENELLRKQLEKYNKK